MKVKKTFKTTYCRSGKVRYRTEQQAKAALRYFGNQRKFDLEKSGVTTYQQCRVYFHFECHAFHTTSEQKKGTALNMIHASPKQPELTLQSLLESQLIEEATYDEL